MNAKKNRLDDLDYDIIVWALDRYAGEVDKSDADLTLLRESIQDLGEYFNAKIDLDRRDPYSKFAK
jgi:hypothetical protein